MARKTASADPAGHSPLVSSVRIVGNLVITSGTDTDVGDSPTQIRHCFEELKRTLESAGASLETVDKVTVYLSDLSDREKYLNGIWREYFPRNPPCRTTIQVTLAPNTK